MKKTSFRDAISKNKSDQIIFSYELRSQPDKTLEKRIPEIHKRNENILTIARDTDIVILNEQFNKQYHSWLRNFGLSTDNIYVFNSSDHLTDLIKDKNFKKWLDSFPGNRIYVPRFSSNKEVNAAKTLDAKLFGCDEDIVLEYYNKHKFKNMCNQLGLPTVKGEFANTQSLQKVIRKYLDGGNEAFVKDLTSSASANLFIASKENYQEIIEKIKASGFSNFLVEEKINAPSELNDQWVIGLDGNLCHIGITELLIDSKNKHSDNYFPTKSKSSKTAIDYCFKLAQAMKKGGYKGIFGTDVLEEKSGKLFMSDNNTRINGPTIPMELVNILQEKHGPVEAYRIHNYKNGPKRNFEQLKSLTNDFLYDGTNQYGFIPFDLGLMESSGAVSFLTTGSSMEHANTIMKEVKHRLK